jgi:hypothetical protein
LPGDIPSWGRGHFVVSLSGRLRPISQCCHDLPHHAAPQSRQRLCHRPPSCQVERWGWRHRRRRHKDFRVGKSTNLPRSAARLPWRQAAPIFPRNDPPGQGIGPGTCPSARMSGHSWRGQRPVSQTISAVIPIHKQTSSAASSSPHPSTSLPPPRRPEPRPAPPRLPVDLCLPQRFGLLLGSPGGLLSLALCRG